MHRRQVAAAEASEGEGDESLHSHEFSTSFPKRAKKIWLCLMAPYSKSDDSDFIEDEVEDVDGSSMSMRPIFEKPECVEDTLIEHLKQRRMASQGPRHGYDSSSSDSLSDSGSNASDHKDVSEEDSVLSILHVGGDDANDEEQLEEEIVSSEDEWMKNKRNKKNRGKGSGSVKKRIRIQHKELKERDDDGDDKDDDDFMDLDAGESVPSKNNNSKNLIRNPAVALDSSSDEEKDQKDKSLKISLVRRINRSRSKQAKKVTIIDSSSDDE